MKASHKASARQEKERLQKGQYRDVHGRQQMERTEPGQKKTPFARTVLSAAAGIAITLGVWSLISLGQFGFASLVDQTSRVSGSLSTPSMPDYVTVVDEWYFNENGNPMLGTRYKALDEKGEPFGPSYETREEVPAPAWVQEQQESSKERVAEAKEPAPVSLGSFFLKGGFWKAAVSLLCGALAGALLHQLLMRKLDAQNLLVDTSDINAHEGDQHIALPEEIQDRYDWFPDAGAHSSVQVSSLISHMALRNKTGKSLRKRTEPAGKALKQVQMLQRARENLYDEDGDLAFYAGEVLEDENGQPVSKTLDMFDTDLMNRIFDQARVSADPKIRTFFDPFSIAYNPNNLRKDRLPGCDTLGDLINRDWQIPEYETQRPAGAYIVDTAPVNTMVLAITRAGKGQTIIEPTIDCWLREKKPGNMVINDPKGELLTKFYTRGTVRGFEIVQMNLINSQKTDIYNPLYLAYEAARMGDYTKASSYIENLGTVFFPVNQAEDPLWPTAANNAFRRAAFGLMEYYLEEEQKLREHAARMRTSQKLLDQKLDALWGHCTLYNCYQMFVQLSSRKMKNPADQFRLDCREGKLKDLSAAELNKLAARAKVQDVIWEGKPELDLLTIYFNATMQLPGNSMRTLVANADTALKTMAHAEKMLASINGIAITQMSFFTDPTISTLTSGTPSQNVDLSSLSFPRAFFVRLDPEYLKKYNLVGMRAIWKGWTSDAFDTPLSSEFEHSDLITREGWARSYFEGIFEGEHGYVSLEIRNPQSGLLISRFYFRFTRSYLTSLSGRSYIKDPILRDKIVKNGFLEEMIPVKLADGRLKYTPGRQRFKSRKVDLHQARPQVQEVQVPVISETRVRYSEKPKMVFMVTPPHLTKYAKLILIMVKQMVDLNFEQSYMTKANQKPLYKTRFMLDELGNLKSDGHGIENLETMLSIGLGQDQQFTLILQNLQQLRDVYGDSVDKIVQGNTSNIIYLKSTDETMIETLSKMSGTTNKTYTDSKTVTKDLERLAFQTEGKVSYTMSTREAPVISYNDLAGMAPQNSVVFKAGESPIWNRNATVLPMSWMLYENTITDPGREYTLQTIPTLSSAAEFDVRLNQPNFEEMVQTRLNQAYLASEARESYQKVLGVDDFAMEQMDPDILSRELMSMINSILFREADDSKKKQDMNLVPDERYFVSGLDQVSENTSQVSATRQAQAFNQRKVQKRFASRTIAPEDLWSWGSSIDKGHAVRNLEEEIVEAFLESKHAFERDAANFRMHKGNLYSADGTAYIFRTDLKDVADLLNEKAADPDSRVFAEEEIVQTRGWKVSDAFFKFLASRNAWTFANGRFEREMSRIMKR